MKIRKRKAETREEFFWRRVRVGGSDECWDWIAGHTGNGYGSAAGYLPNCMRAHRVAYSLKVGPIPDGMCVCHKCDNRLCCNPAHLFLGSHSENMADMKRKGRAGANIYLTRDSGHHWTKLSTEDIVFIRELLRAGMSAREVAREFNIHATYARLLRRTG